MTNPTPEMVMSKLYKATYGTRGASIITVLAADPEAARERIREQLQRPGRHHYYILWKESGEQIVEAG